MRTNGQAAIDAISAENAGLKSQLEEQAATPPPTIPPAYGPQGGDFNRQSASLALKKFLNLKQPNHWHLKSNH